MSEEFHRIRRLPPYVFAEVNAAKAKARAAAEDIIDLGMGNPDSPTPPHIVAKLVETVQDPRSHRYSTSRGIPGLRRAQAAYYERRFGVKLDPETEVIATLGSKEGLANLAAAITSPGDTILVPNPSYPIHQFGFIIAGASVRSIPAHPGEDMLRAIDQAVRHSVPKPTALIVNFPSNPTAYMADLDFYKELVALARKNEIFIISDIAYAEIYFDGNPPPSVLQVEGAKDIAIEFTSMSKTYSMPGWRMGFGVGNPRLVKALARMKSYLDYNQVTAGADLMDIAGVGFSVHRDHQVVLRRARRVAVFADADFVPRRKALNIGRKQILPAHRNAHAEDGLHQQTVGAGRSGSVDIRQLQGEIVYVRLSCSW
ncbi:MAG: aminotransferase class I/II-fold pyridoxal phosphate-dependent enzyme, partial [Acidocella sp.]|nr:aminotransferase class I/II-fold pyridoxal phosphate-dependent enzyme [Acidocella sp.]